LLLDPGEARSMSVVAARAFAPSLVMVSRGSLRHQFRPIARPVDRADEEPDLNGQELDIRQIDLDVTGDDQALSRRGRGCRRDRCDRVGFTNSGMTSLSADR